LVTIILVILAGVAVPSFRNTYLNLELNDTANRLAFLMRFARAHAVTERATYKLNFDSEKKKCWLTKQSDANADSFEPVSSRLARSAIFPKAIEVETEADVVNFYPDGKIDSINIYLKSRDGKTLTISTKGQIGNVEILDFKI
jgi:Tfp pilus assembly protein FimT